MNSFYVVSQTDPANLAINIKHRDSSHLPASVKKAQNDLVIEIKAHLIEQDAEWVDDPDKIYKVKMEFGFKNIRSDIDGPVKRVLDAIQMALVARGHKWDDAMVYDLIVSKYGAKNPRINIWVEEME
jgi:Holliday junction resolvase RusA-like endonuclease